MLHLGDWQLVRRIRQTRGGVHWQTANGFVLAELPSDIAKAPAKARAFVRDVEAFAAIFRPDIARVVDWASAVESPHVVLEVPAGATLRELAEKVLVPPDVRARIALDALEAVEAAHANGAVFGDLDADSIVISERGQIVLLPTCSRARAATLEDDIVAVARFAELEDRPQTAQVLQTRIRALAPIAQRETVGRFVSRVFRSTTISPPRGTQQAPSLRSMTPAPRQMPRAPYVPTPPPPRALFRLSSADELTPVMPIALKRLPSLVELSPDDLIPVGMSEPEIPIYIDEPPDPYELATTKGIRRHDTERPVVSEPDIVVDLTTPARRRRSFPLMLFATLCAACAIAVPLFWRDATTWLHSAGLIPLSWQDATTWLRSAVLIPHRAPRPAPAFEQQAPAAQPPTIAVPQPPAIAVPQPPTIAVPQPPAIGAEQPATAPTPSATAETAASATPPPTAPAPAKPRAAQRRRAKRAAAASETVETPKTVETNSGSFVPSEP